MSETPAESGASTAVSAVVDRPAAAQTPASTDMIAQVTTLDRAIKKRRDSDTTLINYWLYIFLVNPITLGIYGIFLFFRRIGRIDDFSERKHPYYTSLLEWTERYAAQTGKTDTVHHEITELRSEVERAYKGDLRPIKAGLSFLLTIVTLGIYGFYVLYRINRYWWDAQVLEQDFDDKFSQTWMKLDLMRYPLTFEVDQSKRRSYALYLILSIITFGLWLLFWWDYQIQVDPDKLYNTFHSVEDTVLQTVRAH
jgi:hypothetical protein